MRAVANSPIALSTSDGSNVNENVENLYTEDDNTKLEEVNLRIHTAKSAPKDKKERHIKHDDCCGYCELYCNDKITDIKRREIEAWRQDIHHIMDGTKHRKSQKLQKQKLKFLTYEPLGSPDKEPGFRRIKTPKDLGQDASGTKTHFQTHKTQYQWKNSNPATKMGLSVIPSRMADLSVQAIDHSEEIDDMARSLLPVSMTPALPSPAFSRDSLDSDVSSLTEHDQVSAPSSQRSYRSCSNQLLNVVTIDDAIKYHRDKMINSNDIRLIESSIRPRNSPHKSHKPPQALTQTDHVSRHERTPHSSAELGRNFITNHERDEFRLHPDSARVMNSRPVSKFSSVALTDSTDLPFSKPSTTMSYASGMRPRTYQATPIGHKQSHDPKKVSSIGAVYQAVNQVVGNRQVHDEQIRRGLYKFEKNYQNVLATKPESRRFKKMNEHLRRVMQDDYVPDHRMANRLQRHNTHRNSCSQIDNKPIGYSISGTYLSHKTLSNIPSATTPHYTVPYNEQTMFTSEEIIHEPDNPQRDNFLGLLADYEDSEISVK